MMQSSSDVQAIRQPWRARRVRFALHLGVKAREKPLFKNLAGSLDPLDHIQLAADLGFAGISDNMLKCRSMTEQMRIGEALAKRGLAMGSFVNSPAGTAEPLWGNPDATIGESFFASIADSIEAAKRSGGRVINLVATAAPAIERSVQLRVLGERLHRAADRAAREGMVIAIEPTSATRLPHCLIHHVSEVRDLLGASNHPALRLMFDTGHVHEMDGDPVLAYAGCRGIAVDSVQLANARDRLEPGSGETDFLAFLRYLMSIGFEGLLELEHYLNDDTQAAEVRALQRLGDIVDQL